MIDWDLPKGFSVSDIKWPLPEKIEYPPLMTYGYEDFVIYPMVLSIPADYSDDYFEMVPTFLFAQMYVFLSQEKYHQTCWILKVIH